VEHERKLYAFSVSMRWWGQIMAEDFDPGNKDLLAYTDWAFMNPYGEDVTIDESKDPMSRR
jgi:hypothetical protein